MEATAAQAPTLPLPVIARWPAAAGGSHSPHRHVEVGEHAVVAQYGCNVLQMLQDEGRVGHAHAQHAAPVCRHGGARGLHFEHSPQLAWKDSRLCGWHRQHPAHWCLFIPQFSCTASPAPLTRQQHLTRARRSRLCTASLYLLASNNGWHSNTTELTRRQHLHQGAEQLGQGGANVSAVGPRVLAGQPDLTHLGRKERTGTRFLSTHSCMFQSVVA